MPDTRDRRSEIIKVHVSQEMKLRWHNAATEDRVRKRLDLEEFVAHLLDLRDEEKATVRPDLAMRAISGR